MKSLLIRGIYCFKVNMWRKNYFPIKVRRSSDCFPSFPYFVYLSYFFFSKTHEWLMRFYLNFYTTEWSFLSKSMTEEKKSKLSKFLTADKTGQFLYIGWSSDQNMTNNLKIHSVIPLNDTTRWWEILKLLVNSWNIWISQKKLCFKCLVCA